MANSTETFSNVETAASSPAPAPRRRIDLPEPLDSPMPGEPSPGTRATWALEEALKAMTWKDRLRLTFRKPISLRRNSRQTHLGTEHVVASVFVGSSTKTLCYLPQGMRKSGYPFGDTALQNLASIEVFDAGASVLELTDEQFWKRCDLNFISPKGIEKIQSYAESRGVRVQAKLFKTATPKQKELLECFYPCFKGPELEGEGYVLPGRAGDPCFRLERGRHSYGSEWRSRMSLRHDPKEGFVVLHTTQYFGAKEHAFEYVLVGRNRLLALLDEWD